jgi:hypothetical protein
MDHFLRKHASWIWHSWLVVKGNTMAKPSKGKSYAKKSAKKGAPFQQQVAIAIAVVVAAAAVWVALTQQVVDQSKDNQSKQGEIEPVTGTNKALEIDWVKEEIIWKEYEQMSGCRLPNWEETWQAVMGGDGHTFKLSWQARSESLRCMLKSGVPPPSKILSEYMHVSLTKAELPFDFRLEYYDMVAATVEKWAKLGQLEFEIDVGMDEATRGMTPLMVAVDRLQFRLVKALVDSGADVERTFGERKLPLYE